SEVDFWPETVSESYTCEFRIVRYDVPRTPGSTRLCPARFLFTSGLSVRTHASEPSRFTFFEPESTVSELTTVAAENVRYTSNCRQYRTALARNRQTPSRGCLITAC